MDPETMIQYGNTVRAFMSTDAAKAVFSELAELYVREWRSAMDSEKRETAWAKARGLEDLKTALSAVIDAGTYETHKQERAGRKK